MEIVFLFLVFFLLMSFGLKISGFYWPGAWVGLLTGIRLSRFRAIHRNGHSKVRGESLCFKSNRTIVLNR